MTSQPSETEGRPSIQGDSKGYFVYIQGDLDNIPPANLSCRNSGHTWPTEPAFFLSQAVLEAARTAEAPAIGGGGEREESGLPSTRPGSGSLS